MDNSFFFALTSGIIKSNTNTIYKDKIVVYSMTNMRKFIVFGSLGVVFLASILVIVSVQKEEERALTALRQPPQVQLDKEIESLNTRLAKASIAF